MGAILVANTWHALNIIGLFFLAFYAALVGVGYITEGPHYRFKFDAHHPFYSTRRLLVGLGIRLTARILHLAQILLSPLFEASAEVGEWVAQRTSPETQARLHSRFI